MSELQRWLWRLINVIRPNRDEMRLERELASHLRLLDDEFRRRGLSPEDAHRSARLALGGIDQTKERHRDARAFRWLDDARRDAVYAVRMLRRHPIATATATLSLALGIGLNAAVFSVVDWVLLRPLPYPAAHQLVHVFTAGTQPVTGPSPLIYDEFDRLRHATAFRASAVFNTATRVMSGAGIDPNHVVVARVAGDLFSTLGVGPGIGRTFSLQEIGSGAQVVVLGHDLWRRRFLEDPGIAGRTIAIDGVAHTVLGVMPAGRGYPRDAEIWRPLTAEERADDDRELNMVARLRDDVDAERANAEIATLAQVASEGSRTGWAEDVQRTDAGNVRAALQALFVAAMLTLVIACANVAALVGARGADRAGEIAVRGALGATRARVVGQLLTESVVLALAGGALGLLFGQWALSLLVTLAPVAIPRLAEVSLDSRIVFVGLAATLFTGLAVGLAPALGLSRLARTSAIGRLGWHRATPHGGTRRALVFAQIAIAVVLTTGAGLLTRSLQHLIAVDSGFAPDALVSVNLYLRGVFDGNDRQLFHRLISECESLPGVAAAAWSMRLPTQTTGLRTSVTVIGESELKSPATLRLVSREYFDTVGIPLTAGRQFAPADTRDAARVAIVNTTFVRDLLDGRSPLNLRLSSSLAGELVTIVGVVGDVTPAGESERPALYVSLDQLSTPAGYLIVRAQDDPRSIMPALANHLRTTAPMIAVDRMQRVAQSLEESRAVVRFSAQLATTFAALALLLAVIGIYGLTAGEVSGRWRELAVRIALGASRIEALRTVIQPCAVLLLAGAGLGVIAALGTGPALRSLLHGVDPTDLPTLVAAPLMLGAAGLLAAALAARRVLRSDPAVALRNE